MQAEHPTKLLIVDDLPETLQALTAVIRGDGREISNDEMRRLALEGQSPDDHTAYYTKITWPETYRSNCRPLLAFLERLKKEGPPERVRLVFWFDN